ncbi:hypothetical protein PGIGA_G00222860 [Pangasianodon gigas]|uniref:Uncharacterized protein n=1 Tax=Pangasianodon gigas TaxID=30993 RepID=A0ACC5WIR2_PANGG|nr:hypothetical protein [Pangasianodon gigas]
MRVWGDVEVMRLFCLACPPVLCGKLYACSCPCPCDGGAAGRTLADCRGSAATGRGSGRSIPCNKRVRSCLFTLSLCH